MDFTDVEKINTLADMECFLMSWLEPCKEDELHEITFQDNLFTQVMGFRRGFHVHCLYRNADTNEFAFHVEENLGEYSFPNFGKYDTFTECIRGVSEKYMSLWKI